MGREGASGGGAHARCQRLIEVPCPPPSPALPRTCARTGPVTGLQTDPPAPGPDGERLEDLAADVLVELYSPSGRAGGDVPPAAEVGALDAAARALLSKAAACLAPGERGARCAVAVAGLASSIAERDAEFAAGAAEDCLGVFVDGAAAGLQQQQAPPASRATAVALGQLMLQLAFRPERQVLTACQVGGRGWTPDAARAFGCAGNPGEGLLAHDPWSSTPLCP